MDSTAVQNTRMRTFSPWQWKRTWLSVAALCVLLGILQTLPAQDLSALNRDAILGHLNAVITWYRDTQNKVQAAGLPSDAIYEDSTRNLAAEVVRLAFQSARAEATLISASEKNHNANQQQSSIPQRQDFTQMAARISAEIDDTQTRLDEINKQLVSAPRSKQKALLEERQRLEGQLSLDKAVQDAVQKMAAFAEESADTASQGLAGNINQLARSVPEVFAEKAVPKAPAKGNGASSAPAGSSGLMGQAVTLLGRMRSMHEIDQMIKETDHVRQSAENLRRPLRDAGAAIIQRGHDLANEQDTPESAQKKPKKNPKQKPPQNLQKEDPRREYQDLINRFKQISSAAMPLSQEILLLEQTRATYIEWRRSIVRESTDALRSLLIRVIGIALALGIVAILSQVWRNLTFRYIRDPRRRRQFLLLRRFVTGFLVGVVLITGFVSEFSSLATFAGFATAGIAVALQALLLSVAAYFFVVGRYGIRVGDRISIAGVTGDVVEIGLVRLYLMELAGTGVDLDPTGRIVVFSNSVLFQAGTPLFKQIPGTEYSWHELAVTLAPGGNYKLVQDKISKAVISVYEQYRERIERQLGSIERQIEIQFKSPKPEAKLQLAETGVEFVVRYPVDIRTASEIDDHVTRAVVDLVNSDPELKNAIAGAPKIRAAIKG
jgi:small-conductance mechanosensitive channel